MKVTYDPQADAMYFELRPGKVGRTQEAIAGLYLDFDEQGELRGIELLYVSKRAPKVVKGQLEIQLPIAAEA